MTKMANNLATINPERRLYMLQDIVQATEVKIQDINVLITDDTWQETFVGE